MGRHRAGDLVRDEVGQRPLPAFLTARSGYSSALDERLDEDVAAELRASDAARAVTGDGEGTEQRARAAEKKRGVFAARVVERRPRDSPDAPHRAAGRLRRHRRARACSAHQRRPVAPYASGCGWRISASQIAADPQERQQRSLRHSPPAPGPSPPSPLFPCLLKRTVPRPIRGICAPASFLRSARHFRDLPLVHGAPPPVAKETDR